MPDNQTGPQEQSTIFANLMVMNQQTGVWEPLVQNNEGSIGIPIVLPAWVKTDLDSITASQVTIATETTGIHVDTSAIKASQATIATQVTTIATQTTTIATNTGTMATQLTGI